MMSCFDIVISVPLCSDHDGVLVFCRCHVDVRVDVGVVVRVVVRVDVILMSALMLYLDLI